VEISVDLRQLFCAFFIHFLKTSFMANQENKKGKSDRGLASADKETRERVAREGGKSHGSGRNSGGDSDRGLASADKETTERVAREGGKTSRGGK
jgi:general stress protein YciG